MAWEYEALFDRMREELEEHNLWSYLRSEIQPGRMGYRTRTVKAGQRLEAEIYPIYGREELGRLKAAKKNLTREAVQRLNEQRSYREAVLRAEANFDEHDIELVLTYAREDPEYDECQKDLRNFLARVNRRRKKLGLGSARWMAGIYSGDKQGHIHLLMDGELSREEIEKLWGKGYANSKRMQPDEHGIEGAARYVVGQTKRGEGMRGRHLWSCSRNLKKPKVRVSDTRMSNAKVKRIARDFENEAKAVMERVYPGYVLSEAQVKWSEIIDGVYLRVVMRKIKEREKHEGKKDRAQRGGAARGDRKQRAGQSDGGGSAEGMQERGEAGGLLFQAGADRV